MFHFNSPYETKVRRKHADWIRTLATERGVWANNPTKMQSQRPGLLQPVSLPRQEFGREVLQ